VLLTELRLPWVLSSFKFEFQEMELVEAGLEYTSSTGSCIGTGNSGCFVTNGDYFDCLEVQ